MYVCCLRLHVSRESWSTTLNLCLFEMCWQLQFVSVAFFWCFLCHTQAICLSAYFFVFYMEDCRSYVRISHLQGVVLALGTWEVKLNETCTYHTTFSRRW